VVNAQRLVVCVGDRQLLGAEFQWADQGVVDPGGAAAFGVDVVSGPELAKALATDRELADQLVEAGIIDVGADQCPQAGEGVDGEHVANRGEPARRSTPLQAPTAEPLG